MNEDDKVYIGDIDDMLKRVSGKMPFITEEAIYLTEIENQQKIYIVLTIFGVLLFLFILLL